MNNYFNNTLANDVWTSKYQHNNETIEEFFKRISDEFIRLNPLNGCDQNKLSDIGKRVASKSDELIRDLFKALTIIPGGSVLSGIGTNKPVSLSNCFVLKTEDSIESIFDTARNMSQIYKRRGGVGTDLSDIRPRTAVVNNAAKTTGGVVPFMELFSQVTNTIGQDGRRGALMLSIDINHPDSPEFITCKQDLTKVTGANISVKLNDEFKKAVENDKDYILRWPINWNTLDAVAYKDKEYNKLYQIVNFDTNETTAYYKKVKAKELWESIVHCAWNTAEPGILFWSSILDNDPASVYPEFEAISTNPCQPSWATVLTPEGIKTFKDIEIGSTIWSKDGWTKVVNKFSTGVKEVYEYRTTRNVFYGTKNHRIVQNGEKVEVNLAKEIDTLQGISKDHVNINIQDVIDGLVIGDGSVHKASNNLVFLCIGENDHDYFNSIIKDLIKEHRPGLKETAYIVDTTIQSEELPLTFERQIPDRFYYGNYSQVIGFLKGLYSANGSIVDKRITLKTSSSKLRDQVQVMLSSIGINSYYTTNKKKNVEFDNGTYECKESYDINISTDRLKFYETIGFLQEYKNEKLKEIIQTKNSNRKFSNIIKSKTYISTEEVFDITVDNQSHTYWTGGCNVSNCGEIPLSPFDSCRLIATNLLNLVSNPFTEDAIINKHEAEEVFYIAQVVADILVDLEVEAVDRILTKIQSKYTPETRYLLVNESGEEYKLWLKIREIGLRGRRTGTGLLGLADMLAALDRDYNDLEIIEEVMNIKFSSELNASIDLAIIKEPFPAYKSELEYQCIEGQDDLIGTNNFYKFLAFEFPEEYQRMLEYGRRNISWSTINSVA